MTRQTVLYPRHVALGAKLIPFAGYDMPVRYSGDKEEHLAVRQAAGMFDVSHMGEFIIRGPHALGLLQWLTSNDVAGLRPGKAQYSCMPNEEGGIVDDIIVYHIAPEQYMMVVNAANIAKDWAWISSANERHGAELIDVSERTALIAVSGPASDGIVQALAGSELDVRSLETYACWKGTFCGAEKTLVATTGYTGERTYELFLYAEHALRVWDALMEAGAPLGLIPTGLGARDTLRLEMGYMLYGQDIDDSTSPLEAGLGWITKLGKGAFCGREAIARVKAQGLERKLVGFEVVGQGIPRAGYELVHGGEVVGRVTSGTMGPSVNVGIGMGYVPVGLATPGTELHVRIRQRDVPVRVVKPPFLKRQGA